MSMKPKAPIPAQAFFHTSIKTELEYLSTVKQQLPIPLSKLETRQRPLSLTIPDPLHLQKLLNNIIKKFTVTRKSPRKIRSTMFRNILIGRRQRQHSPRESRIEETKQSAQGLNSQRAKHSVFEVTLLKLVGKKKRNVQQQRCLLYIAGQNFTAQSQQYGNQVYCLCIWKPNGREQIQRSSLRGNLTLLSPDFLGS